MYLSEAKRAYQGEQVGYKDLYIGTDVWVLVAKLLLNFNSLIKK